MPLHASLITVLCVAVLAFAMVLVGRARRRHGVVAPAVSGPPEFERAFRAHQNTLEQAVMFLPMLWLATRLSNEMLAAGLGYAWLVGRVWYVIGYVGAAGKRAMGFFLSFAATAGLMLMALWGIAMRAL